MNGFRLTILVAVVVTGCQTHDIGQPCPQLELDQDPATGGTGRTVTQEVVEQDVTFPCDQLICIATAGKPGYCSQKCGNDAGCPDGFSCRIVQPVGDFSKQGFCAWKQCNAAKDCGSVDDFCCKTVPGSGAGQDLKYCAFSNDGECG